MNFFKTSLLPTFFRVLAAVVSFAVVPIVMKNTGLLTYGIFSIFVTFRSFQAFSDLGNGNGILGSFSGKNILISKGSVVRILRKLYLLNLLIAVFGMLLFIVFDLNALFNIPLDMRDQFLVSCLIFSFGSVPFFSLTLAQKIQIGQGKYLESSLWINGIYTVSNLGILFVSFYSNPLSKMVFFLVVPPSMLSVYYLSRCFRQIESMLQNYETKSDTYSNSSRAFLVLQVATAVATQIDPLIISIFLEPEQVAIFSACLKFVSVILILLSISITSVWPNVSRFLEGGNYPELLNYLRKIFLLYLFFVLLLDVVLYHSFDYLVENIYSDRISLSFSFKLVLLFWLIVFTVWQLLGAVLNGFRMEVWLVKFYVFNAIANLLLSIVLILETNNIASTLLATIITTCIFLIFPMIYKLRALLVF